MLKFNNVTMKFGNLVANENISFSIKNNEIHALLGENGAGKSTLMSILFGLYKPTYGSIAINDQIVKINNPKDATKLGIAMLPQHFKLVNDMTVWENIVLGNEKLIGKTFLKKSESLQKIEMAMSKYKIKLDLNMKVSHISTSDKQKVELLKMLWVDNNILIFDEPTSILTPQQIDEFIKMLFDLKADGKTIILITHKLDEIRKVADRCTILQKGKYIKTVSGKTTAKTLAKLMIGKAIDLNLSTITRTKAKKTNKSLMMFKNVNYQSHTENTSLKNMSFTLKENEILGIAGIEGNGQSEIFQLVSGLAKTTSGKIMFNNITMNNKNVHERYFHNDESFLSHIPEDRHFHGLFLEQTPAMNFAMQNLDDYKKRYLKIIDHQKIDVHFSELKQTFDIRGIHNSKTKVKALSGGNQQKLIIGREVARNPKILLAMNPTRGLDAGAIRNVYSKIMELRNNGSGILLYSGELDEVLQVSDRILVLNNGQVVGEFKGKFNKEKIGLLMLQGLQKERSK